LKNFSFVIHLHFLIKTDNDDNYKPFSLARKAKKKRRNLRMKTKIDYNDGDEIEESEISDQEFEMFLKKKPLQARKTNSLKRNAIKKKYLSKIINKKFSCFFLNMIVFFRAHVKECELVFLIKWRQSILLSSPCYDEKSMKYFILFYEN